VDIVLLEFLLEPFNLLISGDGRKHEAQGLFDLELLAEVGDGGLGVGVVGSGVETVFLPLL
jgi:hypothetical protein